MTLSASMSNLARFFIPFGLLPCHTPRQRPIHHYFSLLLDFLRDSLRVNVQSATISHSFWTSNCLHSTSTSNLPLFLAPFGLHQYFSPLLSPIRRFFSLLLDFKLPSLHFNVQSVTISRFLSTYIYEALSKKVYLPTTKNSRMDKPCGSI